MFKHINYAIPTMYPIFYQFPAAEQVFGSTFMFGPNIIATLDQSYSRSALNLPKDEELSFCFAHTISADEHFCFTDGAVPSQYDGKTQLILAPGGITPLYTQNLTDPNFSVARGLVLDLDLDLHVNPYLNQSNGEIFLDGGKGMQGNSDYCVFRFDQFNEAIAITNLTEQLGGKPTKGCGDFPGQTFSTLYLYNFKKLTPVSPGYQQIKVNGPAYVMDLIELDSTEQVGVFTLLKNSTFNGKLKLSDIVTMEFSTEVPAPTA